MRPGGFPSRYIFWNCHPTPKLCLPGQQTNKFSIPVIKSLYPRWYSEKLVALTEKEYFSMILGLWTKPEAWFFRFQVKLSMNEYPWIKLTKFMTDHCRIPSKLKPRLFISCFSRIKDRTKFDYWGGEKTYCSSVSVVWWYGYRDYIDFWKQ